MGRGILPRSVSATPPHVQPSECVDTTQMETDLQQWEVVGVLRRCCDSLASRWSRCHPHAQVQASHLLRIEQLIIPLRPCIVEMRSPLLCVCAGSGQHMIRQVTYTAYCCAAVAGTQIQGVRHIERARGRKITEGVILPRRRYDSVVTTSRQNCFVAQQYSSLLAETERNICLIRIACLRCTALVGVLPNNPITIVNKSGRGETA